MEVGGVKWGEWHFLRGEGGECSLQKESDLPLSDSFLQMHWRSTLCCTASERVHTTGPGVANRCMIQLC